MSDFDAKKELLNVVRDIKAYLKAEKESGISEIMLADPAGITPAERERLRSVSKLEALAPVKKQALGCKKCPLWKTRTNVVFSDGAFDARLMFIGEAPGYDEDLQGLPFVGRAGQLLTNMIKAMGLSRDKVYICNVLKCRPPENRSPLPEEVSKCKDYLLKQIEIVSPNVICCLGKHAAQALLDTEVPITKIRGRELEFNGVKLIPTYHPAYLLRNPAAKKEVWEDLKKIMRILSEV